jgi:hypothetical protein
VSILLTDVLWLGLLAVVVAYFWQAQQVKELANRAAQQQCQREDAQFLDGSVGLRRLSLSRDETGRWRLWRQYQFDYSEDGVQRRTGQVIALGARIQGVLMGHSSAPQPLE